MTVLRPIERVKTGPTNRAAPHAWEVLLIRRSKAPMAGYWSLPGGSLELGETVQHAAVRETLEETSLRVACRQENEPIFVTQYIEPHALRLKDPSPIGSKAHFVLLHMMADHPLPRAVGTGGDQVARAASDAAEVRWFSVAKLADIVRKQQLKLAEKKNEKKEKKPATGAADAAAAAAAAEDSAASDAPPAQQDLIIPVTERVVREAMMRRRAQIQAKEAEANPRLHNKPAASAQAAKQTRRPAAAAAATSSSSSSSSASRRPTSATPRATPWPKPQRDAIKKRRAATSTDGEEEVNTRSLYDD